MKADWTGDKVAELTALVSAAEDAIKAEPCAICGYRREMTHHLDMNAKGYHQFQLDQPYAPQFDGPETESCPHCGAPGPLERVWADQYSAGHVVHACDPYDLARRIAEPAESPEQSMI
jgi:hypothetical protein